MAENNFLATVKANAPGLCTAGSIIAQIGGAVLAFYEGYQFYEDWNSLPDDADGKTKALCIARRVLPIVGTVGAGCGLSYAAYAESTRRIAALSAAYAAAKLDNDSLKEFKEKAKNVLGEKKTEEVEKEIKKEAYNKAPTNLSASEWMGEKWIYDKNTGYMWKTTFEEFLETMNDFNRELSLCYGDKSISDFYASFSQGVEEVPAYDYIRFSNDKNMLAPRFVGSRLLPNMDSALEIDYEYNGLYD